MAVSKKQLKANRANAKKSTGPKTVEGKEIASANATRFGLYSQNIIINSPNYREDPEAFINLLNSLILKLNPDGAFQLHLVHKIANCLWRSQRAIRAETAIVNRQLDHIDQDLVRFNQYRHILRHVDEGENAECDEGCDMTGEEEARFREIETGRQSIPQDRHAINLLRYEMRLDRQLTRAYKLLMQLQTADARQRAEDAKSESLPPPLFCCPVDSGHPCTHHRGPGTGAPPLAVGPDDGAPPLAMGPSSPRPLGKGSGVRDVSKNNQSNPFPPNRKEDTLVQRKTMIL